MKRIITLCALLLVVMLQFAPSSAEAQCGIHSEMFTTMGTSMFVFKKLTQTGKCAFTMSNNAIICDPLLVQGSLYTRTLSALASGMAISPSCAWTCSCAGVGGIITINGSDGLPVELLEFSIGE